MRESCSNSNHDHLCGQLYANDKLLAIRIATHKRYTVPPVDLTQWTLDLISWQGDEQVLDVGCGSGQYMAPVTERLTEAGRYLAGDLSSGMLRGLPDDAPAANMDVVTIPLPSHSCDVVLANHVLHHAHDVGQAVAECHRVLCAGGRLVAVTNSQSTMTELVILIREGFNRLGTSPAVAHDHVFRPFTLENGQATLTHYFDQVERHILHSALVFPEPAPLLAYVDSMRSSYEPGLPNGVAWDDLMHVWHKMISEHIAQHRAFRIGKVVGAFVAVKHHCT